MAITISNKIGPVGQYPNLPDDVRKIANALNRISVADGGVLGAPPDKRLDETSGIMSEKLLAAIQTFQLKQFGWPGADRRVFPGGETITRMNQLLPDDGPIVVPTTNIFMVSFAEKTPSTLSILVVDFVDPMNDLVASYYTGRGVLTPKVSFTRQVRMFWRSKPISVLDFEGAELRYTTSLTKRWVVGSSGAQHDGFHLANAMSIKLRNSSHTQSFDLPDDHSFNILEAYLYSISNRQGEPGTFLIGGPLKRVVIPDLENTVE